MSDDWYEFEWVSSLCRMFKRLSISKHMSTRENHANIIIYAHFRAF